ncbi:MAG TPA: hypothetical protein VFN87_15505 [Solirubrobacteraceae bacterium]|nr:hypothetical protein [Solirubrobacteraceae bacterium]
MATDEHGDLNIDLIAASLRADAGDLGAFVEALAVKLEEAVPGAVRVERRRDGLFGPKLVRRITLDAAGQRLELRAGEGTVQTTTARLSGGIVLKTEQLDTEPWLQALGETLAAQAQHSESTRLALERLLNE